MYMKIKIGFFTTVGNPLQLCEFQNWKKHPEQQFSGKVEIE